MNRTYVQSQYLPFLIIFCWLCLGQRVIAQAQDRFPQPTDSYVSDYAGVINSQDETQIRTLLADLKQQTGIEATVVAISHMADYSDAPSIEALAPRWFNSWGIGDKVKNNGALILVAVNDRQMRIALGKGYTLDDDKRAQRIIDDEMLPAFRQGDYSTGITRGALALARTLGGDQFQPPPTSVSRPATRVATNLAGNAAASSRPVQSSRAAEPSWYATPGGMATLGGGAAALAGGGYALREYLRRRPRRCPQCQQAMLRLDEDADDAHLNAAQKLEELLGSVDYDVWRCPGCGRLDLNPYPAWFTVYGQCPRCSYKTMKSDSTVLESATEHSTGRKRIDQDCENCNYHHSETVIIPRVQKSEDNSSSSSSSSSSGSSFGGGSSSGGGASGRW